MFKIFFPSGRILPLTAAVAILSLSAGYFTLAWSEPSGTMPVTVDAPINAGGAEQTKTGTLRILGGDFKLDGGQLRTWGETVIHSDYDGSGDGAIRFVKGPSGTELFRIQDGGNIGIGTVSPTDLLSLSSNGITSINLRSGSYTYLGTDYSAWTTILGQNVRARRGATANMELGSGYKGSGASALRLNWDKIEFHSASATDIASLSEGSPFSFPKMTIQSDGKIVINEGGQFCIGSTCVSSSTWAAMASGAGGGGGKERIVLPVDLIPSDAASTLGTSPGHDFSFDPSANKLSVVVYGNLAGGKEVAAKTISMSDLSFSSVSAQGSGVATVNGIFCTTNQGDSYSTGRRYDLYCSGYGVACLATEDNLTQCSYYNGSNSTNLIVYGYSRFSNISHYKPTKLRTDGTYLYAIAGGASYVWKIKLEAGKMVVVGQGSEGSTLPSGLMGENFSYNGDNYSASLSVPDRFYYYNPPIFSGSGSYYKGVIGYPEVILEKN